MISSHTTYQMGLERINDLRRREAEAWRSLKLARRELNRSPSTTTRPEQPLQPNHDQAAHTLAA